VHERTKEATAETRALSDDEIRERIIRLGFGGDRARFDAFVAALRAVIPPTASVVVRGSAVTGTRWADGQPFDADGPGTSDLDLAFVGGEMLACFEEFYIPGLHTAPLDDAHPEASHVFAPLRRALCSIAGRPVNIQATSNLVQYARDILLDQPYFTLLERQEGDDDAGDETRDE
jgi:hypothetical protein